MRLLCVFSQCQWVYLGAFEQYDPSDGPPGTQGSRGLYQCPRCKTVSIGSPIDPAFRQARDLELLRSSERKGPKRLEVYR
jgi:hypothetical protein